MHEPSMYKSNFKLQLFCNFFSIFPSFLLLKNGVQGGSGSINQDHAQRNTTTNYKHTALLQMHLTGMQRLKMMKS